MRSLRLVILATALVACTHPRPPAAPRARVDLPRVIGGREVRLRFTGNSVLSDSQLRAETGIDKDDGRGDTLSAEEFGVITRTDVLLVTAAYYDHGYLLASVGTPSVYRASDKRLDVIIPILREGPRFRVGTFSAYERDDDGNKVPALDGIDIRARFREKTNEWFARDRMVADLLALRTFYRDRGYAFVEADPETDLDEEKAIVDIMVPLRRGPLAHVESIAFTGNARTSEPVLRAALGVREGELYGETRLMAGVARVRTLPSVQNARFSIAAGSAADKVAIEVEIEEGPRRSR